MKNYTRPNAKKISFDVMDIITTSGQIVTYDSLTGASKEMYEIYKNNSDAKNTNVSVFTW